MCLVQDSGSYNNKSDPMLLMHQQQYWMHVEAADASAAMEESFDGAADVSATVLVACRGC